MEEDDAVTDTMGLLRSPKRVTFAPDPAMSDDSLSMETPPVVPQTGPPGFVTEPERDRNVPATVEAMSQKAAPLSPMSSAPYVVRDLNVVSERDVHDEEVNIRRQTEQHIKFLQRMFDSVATLQSEIKLLETRLSETEAELAKTREEKDMAEEDLDKQKQLAQKLETEIKKLKQELDQLNKQLSFSQGDLREEIERQIHEIEGLKDTVAKQNEKLRSLRWLKTQVDAYHLAEKNLFEEPCHACMLPDNYIVVADVQKGLMLFNDDTELIKHVYSNKWKWPEGLAQDVEHGRIFVSLKRSEGTTSGAKKWARAIGVFSLDLDLMEFVQGPTATAFDNSAKENIAYSAKSGDIFWGLMDAAGSGLWSKNLRKGDAEWVELTKRSGLLFSDLQVFPTITSHTDLLVVETAKGYVHRLTVSGSDVLNQSSHAPVARPGAIGVDDEGNIFIHDCQTGKILQLDRMDFSVRREICLVDDDVYSITACRSYLGIAVRSGKQVYVFKYHTDAEYD